LKGEKGREHKRKQSQHFSLHDKHDGKDQQQEEPRAVLNASCALKEGERERITTFQTDH